MGFSEVIQTNPPRLVVQYQLGDDGSESFQWGIVGNIPILTMLGYLLKVQVDLLGGGWIPDCGEHRGSLVILWDAEERELSHYVDPDVPATPLAGMLETVKAAILAGREAQKKGAEKIQLYGADGTPLR